MSNQLKNIVIGALLVVVVILVLALLPKKNDSNNGNGDQVDPADVTDYHSCVEAGYPVLESFPLQCKTPDGRTFVEDTSENAEVVIDTPMRGALVASPLNVTGKAKNNWFFEANIPLTLKDTNGKIIAQVGGQAQSDWMTPGYVNFTGVLTFAKPDTEFGVLLVQKDNPSGLPENDAEYAIPVRFR
jgi:hypothetical protein